MTCAAWELINKPVEHLARFRQGLNDVGDVPPHPGSSYKGTGVGIRMLGGRGWWHYYGEVTGGKDGRGVRIDRKPRRGGGGRHSHPLTQQS